MEVSGTRIFAALYMVPYHILQGGERLPIVYLYALATAPEYRGKKIMSGLVEKSFSVSRERGQSLSVLVPAQPSLSGFYRRFGYEYLFDRTQISKSYEELKKAAHIATPPVFSRADHTDIWRLYRQSVFCTDGCIVLSEKQNRFYVDELIASGGHALTFSACGKEHYVLMAKSGEDLTVLESTVDRAAFRPFCAALIESYSFETANFIHPLFADGSASVFKKPYAMAKSLDGKTISKPFLNRVFT